MTNFSDFLPQPPPSLQKPKLDFEESLHAIYQVMTDGFEGLAQALARTEERVFELERGNGGAQLQQIQVALEIIKLGAGNELYRAAEAVLLGVVRGKEYEGPIPSSGGASEAEVRPYLEAPPPASSGGGDAESAASSDGSLEGDVPGGRDQSGGPSPG